VLKACENYTLLDASKLEDLIRSGQQFEPLFA